MSETMVLALEGRCEPFTLGRGIDLAKVVEMEQMADRCGFKLAGMRAFDAAIGEEELNARRAAAAARRGIAV